MRVAVVADSHFEEASRWEDCLQIHAWIAKDMKERGVDLMLHSGDIYEKKSTPFERLAVASWLRSVADTCPIVIVRGNHDAIDDLAIFGRLKGAFPVVVEQRAGTHLVKTEAGPAFVQALAYPRKGEVLAGIKVTDDPDVEALRAVQGILRGFGSNRPEQPMPTILLTHTMVRGSISSVGQPLVGVEMELGLDDLALARSDFAALGHIHARQDWTYDGIPMVYPGSPRRTAFGEMEPKGYVIADFEGPRLSKWYRVETPARPMLHVQWSGDELPAEADIAADGAEIRLRYEVSAVTSERMEAKERAQALADELIARGAANVKVEEKVVAVVRARAPEVSASNTVPEKLIAHWQSRQEMPDEPTAKRLLGKLNQLESEVMEQIASEIREA